MVKVYHGVGVDDTGAAQAKYSGKKMVWVNPCFQRWKAMLKRCYGDNSPAKSDRMIAQVCERWLYLSEFEKWMLAQDWQHQELDKDLLSVDEKIYSPDTCAFVPKSLNYFLGAYQSSQGGFPLGVSYDRARGKYSAHVRLSGKSTGLGRFESPESAHSAYQKAKAKAGRTLLKKASPALDRRVRESLEVIVGMLSDDLKAGRETVSIHPTHIPESYRAEIRRITS